MYWHLWRIGNSSLFGSCTYILVWVHTHMRGWLCRKHRPHGHAGELDRDQTNRKLRTEAIWTNRETVWVKTHSFGSGQNRGHQTSPSAIVNYKTKKVYETTSLRYRTGLWSLREEKPKDELQIHPSFLPGFPSKLQPKKGTWRQLSGCRGHKAPCNYGAGCGVGLGTQDEGASQGRVQKPTEGHPWGVSNTKLDWYRARPGQE